MAIFQCNPKGWAELLRRAALLVVTVLLSVRLPPRVLRVEAIAPSATMRSLC